MHACKPRTEVKAAVPGLRGLAVRSGDALLSLLLRLTRHSGLLGLPSSEPARRVLRCDRMTLVVRLLSIPAATMLPRFWFWLCSVRGCARAADKPGGNFGASNAWGPKPARSKAQEEEGTRLVKRRAKCASSAVRACQRKSASSAIGAC